MKIIELTGTTDGSGDLTMNAGKVHTGFLEKIVMVYIDGATGADLVITNQETTVSEAILTVTNAGVADVVWYPRTLANKVADASAYTDVFDKIFMAGKLRIVVAQGGAAADFRFFAYLSDE